MGCVLGYRMELVLDRGRGIRVVLSEAVLADLDSLARKQGVRRVHLVREAVAEYLRGEAHARTEHEMGAYVEALADASGEIVAETDAHTIERLLRETEW
jgi:metal-responsive CopG/Arc/MetJ family transcriptional regulator